MDYCVGPYHVLVIQRAMLAVASLFVIATDQIVAQGSKSGAEVSGRVTQTGDTSIAVAGADVEIVGIGLHRVSNSAGRFVFAEVPAGDYEIRARKVGYRPVVLQLAVKAGMSYRQDIEFKRLPQTLTEVRIDGRLLKVPVRFADAYIRASHGVGKFFTRDDIAQLSPIDVNSLLNWVPTVRATDRGVIFPRCQGNIPSSITGRSSRRETLPKVQVYIDGVRVTNYNVNDSTALVNQVSDALRSVHPSNIEVIEGYSGITRIPPEFAGGACAVIAIWTK